MTTETSIAPLRTKLDQCRASGATVGFVPTMGFLHDGHGSLMRTASERNDVVVASIFVNPLQFAPNEDLDRYPRNLEGDTAIAATNGVDHLFVPTVDEMYPQGNVLTNISVSDLSERWDGVSRPEHFGGVATVVSKLFNIIGPCHAYFGEKDYQQLAIVRRMVTDLSIPVEVVGCPTLREADGLAMSSRNSLLTTEDRAAAVVLRRALDRGMELHGDGETDPERIVAAMTEVVSAEPRARLDYAAAVDPTSIRVPEVLGADARLLIAAWFGTTRLIDNTASTVGGAGQAFTETQQSPTG